MTTSPQTGMHQKAHAFSAGFEMIIRFKAATRQGLADTNQLTRLADCDNSISRASNVSRSA